MLFAESYLNMFLCSFRIYLFILVGSPGVAHLCSPVCIQEQLSA